MSIEEKIDIALKDQNILNIMNKAASTFHSQLDEDEIKTCKLNALWKSICNHKKNKAAKFTTYLFNGVRIECIREVKFKAKDGDVYLDFDKSYGFQPNRDYYTAISQTDLLDVISKCPDANLLIDRAKGHTIKEISERHGRNRETVRRKLKNSTKVLRRKLS